MVAGHFDEVRSALDIFVKDMGLVTGAADNSGAEVPLSRQPGSCTSAGTTRAWDARTTRR